MAAVEVRELYHSYETEAGVMRSLTNVSMTVEEGELVAVLGHNGCGKSTLVKHLNALIPVQWGHVAVSGMDVSDESLIWRVRRKCGMVFQNPANQFVSSVVGEDIAFGLRNYDVPEEEIPARVSQALRTVGLEGFEERSPQLLSGGQKQRAAIAGVLALSPEIIIFDEATSMLDPQGRGEVLDTIKRLHEQERKTIIMISHFVEEAVFADRVILIHNGEILAQGTPREMLTDRELLRETGLLPPMAVRAYYDLLDAGIELPECPLTNVELGDAICRLK